MFPQSLVPAAQYLRMSTEHQQYSLDNQKAVIRRYAGERGLHIVRTYSDAAKTGVVLARRQGLRQLLRDVVSGSVDYKAILVYDVSRWGRFQDADEAAHYEFLCKSAGVPVHYCAEMFENDGTLPSLILKALKRTMAAEYSRELGVKVLAGQKRLAHLGFKQGGIPGYGLRRMLVSPDGKPKQSLADGERKSLATDRVVLVPGPENEQGVVRDIFRMLIVDGLAVYGIARELNRRCVPYVGGSQWTYQSVFSVLTNPKYAGSHVFGRTTSRLYTKSVALPKSEWVVTPKAFPPLVDQATFEHAQRILDGRTIKMTDTELLERLRILLAREGRLSLHNIKRAAGMPSPSTFRHRFGSLRHAYELIGYGLPGQFEPLSTRLRTQSQRNALMDRVAAMFPHDVSIFRRGGRWRSKLRIGNRFFVSVLVARRVKTWKTAVRWQVDPVWHERRHVTLLARLSEDHSSFVDFHVLRCVDRRRRFTVKLDDPWLKRSCCLESLRDFLSVVRTVARERRMQ